MSEADLLEQTVAVVLAGGYGTRVQHLLPEIPKPMAPVAGKPFLEWVVRYLGRQGIAQVVLSAGYHGDKIEAYFQAQPVPGVKIYCYRETQPLGTAGGFLHVAREYQEFTLTQNHAAWLVLNGDSLAIASLAALTDSLLDSTVDGAILGVWMADASRYGSLVCGDRNTLLQFAEKRSGSGTINAGVYLLRHSLLSQFPTSFPLSFEKDVFPHLLKQKFRLNVVSVEAPFLDIGTPESLPQAEAFIQQNHREFRIDR